MRANNRLIEAQQKLVLDNYNLIYTAIKGMHIEKNVFLEKEDLEQIALLALCNAASTFDKGKGAEFSTYAVTVMRNYLYDSLRDLNRSGMDLKAQKISLNEAFEYKQGEDSFLGISDQESHKSYGNSNMLMDLDAELKRMEAASSGNRNKDHNLHLQAFIVRLLLAEKTVKEICDSLHISLATYYRQLEGARVHLAVALK